MSTPALEIQDLHAWYGESHVLHGINLQVAKGEVVTLLGRNGAGRTTTLRAILGLTGSRKGSIRIHGTESINLPTYRIAHLGIGYCPEERGIFASLTCEENLLLPPVVGDTLGGGMSLSEIYEMFPNLEERKHSPGTRLSGGEQQMLAIGRALISKPRLLMLDEPSMGLAPLIVAEIFRLIKRLRDELGLGILLVEQNARAALRIADRACVMSLGKFELEGTGQELLRNPAVAEAFLGGHRPPAA